MAANLRSHLSSPAATAKTASYQGTTGGGNRQRPVIAVSQRGLRLKRFLDVVLSASLLLLLAPLMAFIAVCIARDGGSPLFRHRRVGCNGVYFQCLKFRSMRRDARALLDAYLEQYPEEKLQWQCDHKLKNDPRITRIGRFLRKTSLDELPQLWNVLKGDMSLVGVRPVVQEELVKYGSFLPYYLALRPGLTGLWQVSGRNDVTYEQRVAMDAWYVQHRTLRLDMKILLQTVNVVFRQSGAY